MTNASNSIRPQSTRTVTFGIVTLLAACILLAPARGLAAVNVLHSDAGGLDIEITTPLTADTITVDGVSVVRLDVEDWATQGDPGEPVIPYLVLPISVPPDGGVRAMVVSRMDTSATFGPVQSGEDEWAVNPDGTPLPAELSKEQAGLPSGEVAVDIIGQAADIRVARLIVRPVKVNGSRVTWAKRMQIAVRFTATASRIGRVTGAGSTSAEHHPAGFTINADQISAFQSARASSSARISSTSDLLPNLLRKRRLQLYLKYEGIYRITGDDLAGWLADTDINVSSIDPATFRLYNRDREVPLYVEGENSGVVDENTYIEFYGKPNTGRYQDIAPDSYNDPYVVPSIYRLTWGDDGGARMADEDVGIQFENQAWVNVPRTYPYTVHYERDDVKLQHHSDEYGDRYFITSLTSDLSAEFTIEIPSPAEETLPVFRAMARGVNSESHYIEYQLQGVRMMTLGDNETFEDQDLIYGESSGEVEVPLVDGGNTIDAIVGDPTSGKSDGIALNWFEVDYDRLYKAADDQIIFHRPATPDTGYFDFTVSGFTTPSISLYKAGVSRLVGYNTTRSSGVSAAGTFQLRFQDRIDGDNPTYIAVTNDRKLLPFRAELVEPWSRSLKDRTRTGDYLMIVHPALMDSAQTLAEYRASAAGGGYSVAMVDARQIYDEFASGYPTADAIREFIQYAYDWWQTPPRYVVIIGDGVDRVTEATLKKGSALVPMPLLHIYKWAVDGSDHPFSLVSGDDIVPDIFVSRIPAEDNADLGRAIRKTIRFEQNPVRSDWRKTAFMVAGSGSGFVGQTEVIANDVPERYDVKKLFSSSSSDDERLFYGNSSKFLSTLNKGALWTVFIGHGGGGVWSVHQLLHPEDAEYQINNTGMAGIYLSMTCFTGAFQENDDAYRSLSETMLFDTDGGAVAWFGATGVGWYFNDFYLAQSIASAGIYNSSRQATIGEIIAAGKTDYLLRYSSANPGPTTYTQGLLNEFNLTGDPALKVSPPDPSISLAPETRTPVLGQTIGITGTVGSTVDGIASMVVYDDRDSTVATFENLTMTSGTFSTSFIVPTEIVGTGLGLKAYAATDDEDWSGYVRLAVAESLVDSVSVSGQSVSRDSIYVSAKVYDIDGIKNVFLEARLDAGSLVDNIEMVQQASDVNRYRTTRPLNLASLSSDAAAVVELAIRVTDSNDEVTEETEIPPLYPNRESNISITSVELDGTARAELAVSIENTGAGESDSTQVDVWLLAGTDTTLVGTVVGTPLAAQSSATSVQESVIGNKLSTSTDVTVDEDESNSASTIYPRSTIIRVNLPDSLVQGNSPGVDLLVTAGTTYSPAADNTQYTVPSNWGVFHPLYAKLVKLTTPSGRYSATISPGALTDSTLVTIDEVDVPAKRGQPDITAPEESALKVDWRGTAEVATDGVLTLSFVPDTTIAAIRNARDENRLWVGYWNEDSSQWEVMPVDQHSWDSEHDTLLVSTHYKGRYSLVIVEDDTPPTISVSVSQQTFGDGAYVGENPRFVIYVEDRNGVSTTQGNVEVYIDNVALSDSAIVVPEERSSMTAISVTATPPSLIRREADYMLRVVASDAVGNEGEYEAAFKIAQIDEPLVTFNGTFPNPFGEDGAVIAFVLSDQVEEMTFRIYDVAGRKVLSFSNYDLSQLRPNEPEESNQDPSGVKLSDDNGTGIILVKPGYHELHWLGTDRNGVKVANGVYFGIMTARDVRGTRTYKETFTMVKAE